MDPLTDVLAGPRARGAFTLRAQFDPPLGMEILDDSPLSVIAVLQGGAVLHRDGQRHRLAPGDVVVARSGTPYELLDAGDSEITVRVVEGNRCVDLEGGSVAESMSHGLRTWGNSAKGRDVLLFGVYATVGEIGGLLTQALPPCIVLTGGGPVRGIVEVMGREIAQDAPGQGAVLDRLLDVLLVSAIRAHAMRAEPDGHWLTARDPAVTDALDLMHREPARPWTLESLARHVGVSRATLQRRFAAEVGEPPMGYLTRLRLDIDANMNS